MIKGANSPTSAASSVPVRPMSYDDWAKWLFEGFFVQNPAQRDKWKADGFLDGDGYLTDLARQYFSDVVSSWPGVCPRPTVVDRRSYAAGMRLVDGRWRQ